MRRQMAMLQAQLQQAQHSDTVWEMSVVRPLVMYHSPETRLYTNAYYRDPLLTLIIVRQKYIIKKASLSIFSNASSFLNSKLRQL